MIKLRQVEANLVREYEPLLDLSDVARASDEQRGKVLRTRALAAEAIRLAARVGREEAARAVTDGTGDNGLDAVYVDQATARLYLVQSKWHSSGTGTIGIADTHIFHQGFKDITDEAYDRFNEKVQAFRAEISAALRVTSLVVEMIVVTTGEDSLSDEAQLLFNDLSNEMNTESEEMLVLSVWGLDYMRARLASETGGADIDLKGVLIENWGSLTEPFLAYYGVVDGAVLKTWFEAHGQDLFTRNIRKALGQTAVNSSLHDTVCESPEKFWYFNNGVTVLCDRISKSARGASTRNSGEFDFLGASVVNGAQTVASVANALSTASDGDVSPKVWIRAISLEGCPPDFAAAVTQATNTQNATESRDFVSLDSEQVRLREDFRLSLSRVYSIKRGEPDPAPTEGCTVTEAAIALACTQHDVALAVIAKSAPGRLWDMQGRYYRQLFNSRTDAFTVWRSVQTMRWVDAALETTYRQQAEGRPRAVNAQGRRIVLWAVFQNSNVSDLRDPDYDWDAQENAVATLAVSMETKLFAEVEAHFGSNYVTSLFKNSSRCKFLAVNLVPQH